MNRQFFTRLLNQLKQSFFAVWNKIEQQALSNPEKEFWQYFVLLSLLVLLYRLSFFPPPGADYWRHLKSHLIDYDYRNLYFLADLTCCNLWWGYDVLLGKLYPFFKERTYIPIQILSFTLYVFAIYFAIKRFTQKFPGQISPYITLIFVACGYLLLSRHVFVARPTNLVSGVFALLWFAPLSVPFKVALQASLTPLYWLTFLYLIPFFFQSKNYRQFFIVTLTIGSSILYWVFFCSSCGLSAYLFELKRIFLISSYRLPSLAPSEGTSILPTLAKLPPSFPFFFTVFYFKKDKPTACAICFFLLSDQFRYFLDCVLPLLFAFVPYIKLRLRPYWVFAPFVVFYSFSSATLAFSGYVEDTTFFKNFTEHKRVLFLSMNSFYYRSSFVFNSQVCPPMEPGYLPQNVQLLFVKQNAPDFDICSYKELYQFDILIEKSLKISYERTPCLKLVATNNAYRLWEIAPPPTLE